MNLIDKSYLHPVLRPGYDDVAGKIDFDLADSIKIEADKYVIDIDVQFENAPIEKLIADSRAKIYAFVYCKANFYRRAFDLNSFADRIEIPTDDLSGEVEVTIIVAATATLNYQNASQHSDYAGASFAINCGDILAVSETNTFTAEKEFDPLQTFESIISIAGDDSLRPGDPLTINYDNDKIRVVMPDATYQDYRFLKKTTRTVTKTLENLILIPVLITILSEWQNSECYEEENRDRKWFRAINARAENLNIKDKIGSLSLFVLAQKMLDAPITRCVDDVKAKLKECE